VLKPMKRSREKKGARAGKKGKRPDDIEKGVLRTPTRRRKTEGGEMKGDLGLGMGGALGWNVRAGRRLKSRNRGEKG